MADQPKPKDPKVITSKCKTHKILIVILVLILIGMLVAYQWGQRAFTYEALQGYWNITGNTYLLISDRFIQFIELFSDGTHKILFEDSNTTFAYTSILAMQRHEYTLSKSVSTFKIAGSSNNPFDGSTIRIVLYPVIGAIQVMKQDKEVARLTKDNQMSIEYLSSV